FTGYGPRIRDGALAWTVFLETYLKRARTQYPASYRRAKSKETLLGIVRDHWLRLHCFLPDSDHHANHQTGTAAALRREMHGPANMGEISLLIDADVGDSNCLL